MPLTAKGEKIEKAMESEYGSEKGKQVFYASKNKGTISGVDSADMPAGALPPTSMPKAAGILFVTKKKQTALFLRRAGTSDSVNADFPGYWCFPGGSREGDETAKECAIRECLEEIGKRPDGELLFHTRSAGSVPKGVAGVGVPPATSLLIQEGTPEASPPYGAEPAPPMPSVDFATLVQVVDDEFEPTLNPEHDGWAWAPVAHPPEPLHPGCQIALDRLAMNELGVARAIAYGQLVSPQKYENVWLFALRITGTDIAWRPKAEEWAVRDPKYYLTDEFLARCNGLPVIWKHPKKKLLDGDEFVSRIVGTVFLPYIAGAEVWAIAKVWVDEAAQMMAEGGLSTSPGVNFADWTVNRKVTLELADGTKEKALFEGDPSLLDHVAVCLLGVWDKGQEPTGIRTEAREDSAMDDKEDKSKDDGKKPDAAKDDTAKKDNEKDEPKGDAKKDAAKKDGDDEKKDEPKDDSAKKDGTGEIMDAIKGLADAVSGLGKRMDAYEADRKDTKKDDSAKKDEGEGKDKDEADRPVADKAKKDAKKDTAKDDSVDTKARLEKLEQTAAEIRGLIPRDRTDADFDAITDAQARADDVFVEFGQRAPRPLPGQTVMTYERQAVRKLLDHSPTWKGKDINAITDDAFPIIRDQVYNEAKAAAANPVNIAPGAMQMVEKKRDGHTIREFRGNPDTWMRDFAGTVQLRGKGNWMHEDLGRRSH